MKLTDVLIDGRWGIREEEASKTPVSSSAGAPGSVEMLFLLREDFLCNHLGGRPGILSRPIKFGEAIRCLGREVKLGLRGMV